jgi:nitroimidazol reductase NimA-like FMN-containing flavoprotein (pyridoxamine 5'-phosphate oxidase superfamily)
MSPAEIDELLALDVPARLATLDRHGFPHVTPLWFEWDGGAFYMTSIADRPHLRRLERDTRAGLCVDAEQPDRGDGQRRNRQVRAVGRAVLSADRDGEWTRRITQKYVRGPARAQRVRGRVADERVVICLRPHRMIAVASL